MFKAIYTQFFLRFYKDASNTALTKSRVEMSFVII